MPRVQAPAQPISARNKRTRSSGRAKAFSRQRAGEDRQQGINSPEVPELLLLIVPKRFRVCPLQKAQVVGTCVPGVSLIFGSYWKGKRKAKGGSRAAKMQVA